MSMEFLHIGQTANDDDDDDDDDSSSKSFLEWSEVKWEDNSAANLHLKAHKVHPKWPHPWMVLRWNSFEATVEDRLPQTLHVS